MDNLFENRTLAISGGMGDIGQAIAIEFAKQKANIALCGISPAGEETAFLETLKAYGVAASYHQVDVADAGAVKQWINEVENLMGTPDLIVANAATVTIAGIHEISPENWSRELRVNLDGAFFMTQAATAKLIEKGLPGRVVFVGSWAGHVPHAHIPAYSVSKAGMRMLCKCMALELAPHQILVNEIAPGFVAAGLSKKVWEENPEMNDQAKQKVPTGKIMTAQDVALQIVNLCRPENTHMTGSTLLMDGGLSLLA